MPPKEGRRMLDELTAFCTQPQFVYSHHWRDGDAVMWDNRCTLHRGRPWPDDQPRHIVRTTITATDVDGLAEMRWVRSAA